MKNKLIEILQAMGRVAFTNDEKADYLLANDVVPVVRCKDCRHWCETSCQIKVSQHGLYSDDYCSYGEKGCRKMTDEQIIKMLESNADYDCLDCDYYKTPWCEGDGCNVRIAKYALELIRRQQAEIERLKSLVNDQQEIIADLEWTLENECLKYSELKAEAIKEFAERLKNYVFPVKIDKDARNLMEWRIDNLVKEMVGDDNGKG